MKLLDENEKIVINNYLGYLISKSNKCSNCMLKHDDNVCFFASACFPNYDYYIKKEK